MHSIRARILFSGLSIIIVLCVILGSSVSYIFYRDAIKNMKNMVSSSATAFAHSIDSEVALFKKELQAVAELDAITDTSLSLEQRKAFLAEEAKVSSFKDFSVSDASGKTYSDTDISDRDYFQSAMNGTPYISSPIIRKTDGSVTIMAAAKINNGTGFSGAVYGGIDYTVFSEIIKSIKISTSGYGYIVDRNGAIIAHPNNEIVTEFATDAEQAKQSDAGIAISSFVDKMTAGESGTYSYYFNDTKRLVSYMPIPGDEGWSLAVIVEYRDLLSNFYNALIIIIAISVGMMIFASIMYTVLASKMAKPIVSVTDRLQKLSSGDLNSATTVFSSKDETGQLSRSLDETITQLKKYIGDINHVLGSIAQNNLNVTVSDDYRGDFVPIKDALSRIVASLNATMRRVNDAAILVNEDAHQSSANAQNLSQSTTEQAATVEELSSTVASIAEQIRVTADGAKNASRLSIEAGDEVVRGNKQMEQLLASMNDIAQSSQEIAKIIKVIDDIAFQTNILALNAAVEAARAGAAGKGFAVVADEVRNLALKSAEAAKNTNTLIASSLEAVGQGTAVADGTAQSLELIVQKVKQVEAVINDIAKAADEQAVSVDNINDGMTQIASVTQNNSATAEEGAASSDELLHQSETLKAIVDEFTLM